MKNIELKIIIIILILTDFSLIAQKSNDIVGKYCREVKHCCIPSLYIEIFPDSTFNYWTGENGKIKAQGYWRLEKNELILNSEKQPEYKNDDYIIQKIQATSDTQTLIHVNDEFGNPAPLVKCVGYFNGKPIKGITDFDGKLAFDFNPLEKIEITFPGYKKAFFENENLSRNDYIFTLKEEDDFYPYFTNETLVVKRNRLYCEKTKKTRKKYTIAKIKNYYEKLKE